MCDHLATGVTRTEVCAQAYPRVHARTRCHPPTPHPIPHPHPYPHPYPRMPLPRAHMHRPFPHQDDANVGKGVPGISVHEVRDDTIAKEAGVEVRRP